MERDTGTIRGAQYGQYGEWCETGRTHSPGSTTQDVLQVVAAPEGLPRDVSLGEGTHLGVIELVPHRTIGWTCSEAVTSVSKGEAEQSKSSESLEPKGTADEHE